MVEEEEFRQKVNRLQSLNSQMEVFEEQLEFIDELIEEHDEAKATMKKYMEKEEGSEMLVPIGASSYLYSKVGTKDKVLIGLGSDISAEKKVEEAVEIIEKRKDEFESNKKELKEKRDELKEEAEELEQEVRQEYQQMQAQQMQQQQQQG